RPVVEKELLHYDILFALDTEGLLDPLTFQGGTSLRLCYGAQRFSEDPMDVQDRTLRKGKFLDLLENETAELIKKAAL
ncbi:MAG TPA: nucleotidyl transferase AbiEii/AbiGii toxin family protein, partial [Woeseiaceae bacterium]|nr:nucleotidyl transferase AbiEii/AbiGii toxin family protein [Woeseiaceae bacterium]